GSFAVTGIDAIENRPTARNAGQKSVQTIVLCPCSVCETCSTMPAIVTPRPSEICWTTLATLVARPTSWLGISAYASECSDVNCKDGNPPPNSTTHQINACGVSGPNSP